MSDPIHPIVKVFNDKGCQSYLVGCPRRREALLVDPKVGRFQSYRDSAARHGLRIVAALDTHTHADHLSASAQWLAEGVPVYMSRHTGSKRAVTRRAEGDVVPVGDLRFRVLEVPGHTVDSIALAGHGMALVGDTLFAGSLARSDFRGSNGARLFDSVTSRLLTLPDDTVVFPGHDYRDVLFTTIGQERAHNPALRHPDGAAYARAIGDVEGRGNTPEVDVMLALNQEADPVLPESPALAAACCAAGSPGSGSLDTPREQTVAEVAPRRETWVQDGRWVDVRDAWEFREGHVPGTVNVPLGELGFHLDELRTKDALLLSCLGGVRSMTAAKTLRYLGVARDPISLHGGYRAWTEAGEPVESKI